MSLSKELAAVLRSVRAVKGLSQQDLGDASDRKHLWLMESAKSSPTLNKFDELAKALQVSPVTLLALCVALRDGVAPVLMCRPWFRKRWNRSRHQAEAN